jgi:8-oxo-dGTP diphosphatase/2-hydroxy-dATP diphosphatase
MKKLLTLTMVLKDERILLGMKKRGFGAGRYNGFGGKVESHESVEEAALRELREEAGIEAHELAQHGILTFTFDSNDDELEVHIFMARDYTGKEGESEEMAPEWFALSRIPYERMWSDDRIWLPYLLAEKKFIGAFHFDTEENVASYSLEEKETL